MGAAISGNSKEVFSKRWQGNIALPARTQDRKEIGRINRLFSIFSRCLNLTLPENKVPNSWFHKENHPVGTVQGKEGKEHILGFDPNVINQPNSHNVAIRLCRSKLVAG